MLSGCVINSWRLENTKITKNREKKSIHWKEQLKSSTLKKFFTSEQNSKTVWSAINQLTNKSAPEQSCSRKNISPDNINLHFTTIADKIIQTNHTKENSHTELWTFCNSKNIISNLMIPSMSVTEVYQALCHLKQSGTWGLNGIDRKILELSAPVIAETLTSTIYALTSHISPFSLSNPRLFLCSNLVNHLHHQITGQFLL